METDFFDRVKDFFFKGFNTDSFQNYPQIHKAFNEKKLDDFFLALITELRISIYPLLRQNKVKFRIEVAEFENGIKKTFAEGSKWYELFFSCVFPYSEFFKLKEIAINCLNELKSLEEQQQPETEGGAKKKKKKPETLFEIFLPDSNGEKQKMYDFYIAYLKQEYRETHSPFVTEINGILHWNNVSGRLQYLAGFIFTCIKNKWIADDYSAPKYKIILGKTFNIDFNPQPFKQLSTNPPKEKYLKPFSNLPANI